MELLPAKVIAGDMVFIMPDASEYHFGVMTSNVHMAWMRTLTGRLKSDYRYSNTVAYNNFLWPQLSKEQEAVMAAYGFSTKMTEADCVVELMNLYQKMT